MNTLSRIIILQILAYCLYFAPLNAQNVQDSLPKFEKFNQKGNFALAIRKAGSLEDEYFFHYYGLRLSCFVRKNWQAGTEIGRSAYGKWERSYFIGAHTRFYWANLGRFSGFSEIAGKTGRCFYDNDITLSRWQGMNYNLQAVSGFSFHGFYKKRISFDFYFGYTFDALNIENHPTLKNYRYRNFDVAYGFQLNFAFQRFFSKVSKSTSPTP